MAGHILQPISAPVDSDVRPVAARVESIESLYCIGVCIVGLFLFLNKSAAGLVLDQLQPFQSA